MSGYLNRSVGRRTGLVLLLSTSILVLAACSSPASSSTPSSGVASTGASSAPSSGDDNAINVTLTEWAVVLDKTTAPAGTVAFKVTNAGTQFKHEFVVIKTDLDPADLPADATGKVDEAGAGIQFIGEIEELEIGASEDASFDLTPGKYVLICNIVEAGAGHESHYMQGMRVAFTVS
ncbi:MAG TPA: copper-binding protein [Methylomirabilota bacterium]|nr:copper-binding protein [Methylomirabilota bacterium]